MEDLQESDIPSTSRELLNSLSPEPVLKASPVVEKGRISCAICLTGSTRKNLKQAQFEKIMNIDSFKEKALEWDKYDHEYNSIHKKLDWSSINELFAHKRCKGIFF